MSYQIAHHAEGQCKCGHAAAAHGSSGMICCACECRKFEQEELRAALVRASKSATGGVLIMSIWLFHHLSGVAVGLGIALLIGWAR